MAERPLPAVKRLGTPSEIARAVRALLLEKSGLHDIERDLDGYVKQETERIRTEEDAKRQAFEKQMLDGFYSKVSELLEAHRQRFEKLNTIQIDLERQATQNTQTHEATASLQTRLDGLFTTQRQELDKIVSMQKAMEEQRAADTAARQQDKESIAAIVRELKRSEPKPSPAPALPGPTEARFDVVRGADGRIAFVTMKL